MSDNSPFVFDGPMHVTDSAPDMIERVSYGLMAIQAVMRSVQSGHQLSENEALGADYLLSGMIETLKTACNMAAALSKEAPPPAAAPPAGARSLELARELSAALRTLRAAGVKLES